MERLSIDILGISEHRWTENDQLLTKGWMLYYSGGKEHQRGVGFLLSPKVTKSVLSVEPINDRIILLRIDAKPRPITFVQVYMPTNDYDDSDVLDVYADLQLAIDRSVKKDRLIVMGDFNVKIGEDTIHPACG